MWWLGSVGGESYSQGMISRASKAGAAALRERLGSDEAVSEHYRKLNRLSVESRRKQRLLRAYREATRVGSGPGVLRSDLPL